MAIRCALVVVSHKAAIVRKSIKNMCLNVVYCITDELKAIGGIKGFCGFDKTYIALIDKVG